MLLSCLPVSLYKEILSGKMSLKEWLILAKSLDLDGADISVMFLPHKSPVPLGKIRRMTQTVGIPIMMMATYTDFTQPNPEIRERELACAIADIAAASELNIPFCRITAGQYYEDQNDQETVKTVAELLAQCDYYAGRWGVTLLLENHSKPGVWDKPDFVFNTKRFLLLYEQIKTLNIGINFDTANTYALGDDSVELFRKVYPRVRSIHVNDLREAYTLDFRSEERRVGKECR